MSTSSSSEINVRAISEAVGLRRESSMLAEGLPLWLAKLHRSLPVGDRVRFQLTGELPVRLDHVLEGAGFSTDNGDLVRLNTLPDIVNQNMRFLVSGLNPSPHAAASGIGFSRGGNRFWPTALAAELVTADRNPLRALSEHRVGFTDLVKRTTSRADELSGNEFQAGLSRLEQLIDWLTPEAMIMVGLSGWRQALDANAVAGWQPAALAGAPVYLMPNTSGLNAHETAASLTAHFVAAQRVLDGRDIAGLHGASPPAQAGT